MATSDFVSLTLPHQRTIDQICVEFEDRWIENPHPKMQPLLDRAPTEIRDTLLAELIKIEVVYRRRRGEAVSQEQYEQRFPHADAAVRAAFGDANRAVAEASQQLQVGDVIDRYRLLECAGHGAFGEVYMARDEALGRDVALKVLRVGERDDLFLEEARTAARLKHSGIATIFDTGRLADDRPYVVMEYVEGHTLRELLDEDRWRFSPQEASTFVARLAETMEYAHQQGIVHRDLEPSNVIVDHCGQAKVTDFGLALHELQQADRGDEVAGSLAYMSPEQLRGKSHHLDERADIWSLGVILYELLCGRRPFAGGTTEQLEAEILEREPKPMRRDGQRLAGRLERVCLRCLRKDPAARWPSAAELARALQTPQWTRWIIAAVLLLVIGGVSAAWQIHAIVTSQVRVDMEVLINLGHEVTPLSTQRPTLHGGDEVYLEIESNRAVHYFVWWVDSAGKSTLLYPEEGSVAGQHQRQHQRTRRLRLPTDETLAWPIPNAQRNGLESIVVLAANEPALPEGVLFDTSPLPLRQLSSPGWFFKGQRLLGRERAAPTDTIIAAPDPLGDWHRALAKRLQLHGAVYAVTFQCDGEPR